MQRRCQNAVWFALAILLAIGWAAVIWRASNVPHPPINQSAADQKYRQPKSETIEERHQATEEAIAYYNKWLMFFTAILAVSTVGLGVATIGLYFAGERQLEHARSEAGRARFNRIGEEARLNEQINIARDSANAATAQAKIAETALLSVEIPYLYPFIRRHGFITIPSKLTGELAVAEFNFGNEFIEYYFQNFGRTPAEITEVQSILLPSMGIPRPYPAGERNLNPLSGHIVAANGGISQDFPFSFNKGMFDVYSQGKFNPDVEMFWFLGFVRYNDVFENEYVRGFCLAYSPMKNRFYPVGNDGYNYRKKIKPAGQEK